MKYIIILAALLMATVCGAKTPQHKNDKEQPKVLGQNPKREFRGAWIQCVNNQWTGIGRERMQNTLTMQLDELKRCGINAIMFQVRAEADALYESKMEPWSRYLTAEQGRAPQPYWDPLAWMVEECHRRGMECHAWINPYRAKTKGTMALSAEHPYFKNPERFFHYDGLMLFDPGQPENRDYICRVAMDIVERYDVDGLHIDDYFYPYPANGLPIPDDASYEKYGNGMARDDWRRDNVNKFIK
ncbi:MAG: family 10 glycosylhydrolase, partial [Bacteroidaceae bacterium]|nr:family 10 glycosylhydrolase [Bacteroidaceae bacterium]